MPDPSPGLTTNQVFIVTCLTVALTFIANICFHFFKNKLDWFDATKKFKREYCYMQLKELYLDLYAVIAQSEYIRDFLSIQGEFDDIPFIEIEKKKITQKISFSNATVEGKEYKIKDAITEFNKIGIASKIIEKSQYSSQALLKDAVAYRFLHQHYRDNTIDKSLLNKFQEDELNLLKRIVKGIVKECNEKLKMCGMEYDKQELENGLIKYSA